MPDDVVDATVAALREQLASLHREETRRRQVTILFADVTGFTALSETRDAELVTETMNALWMKLDAIIHDAGGRIDKHIGDALMAVWGFDRGGEEDPERAVRTGLAVQDAVADFCAATGENLAMRIGINTGPALLGAVGTTGEFTAIGDAVNVASRLEHAAPVGAVLISHSTYRHVRGIFDVEPLEPLRVKGKRDPLRAYIVQRAKPRAFRIPTRGVEGVETRMIGRDQELKRLCDSFHDAVGNSRSRRITVLGEAGIGKSRLLYEFENWLELRPDEVYFFKGRALASRESIAFGLFRSVVAHRVDILDSDSASVVADKLRAGMSGALDAGEAEIVGHWLGLDLSANDAVAKLAGSPEFGTVAQAHFVAYLRALAAESPVTLMLEDLHWADDDSLDLVERLEVQVSDLPVFIVGVARPSLLERRPEWQQEPELLRLGALTRPATRELVEEVLQRANDAPDALIDLIVERSDGNAFYVEELVSMLIDETVIRADDEAWSIDSDRLQADRIPPTLTAVLQARLDGLAAPDRRVLQHASVVGRVFWDEAVVALGDSGSVDDALRTARDREFVFTRGNSSFDGTEEYIFKHALLRDVTYETVLLRDRESLHRATARWIEAMARDRVGEYLEMIAEHYVRANEPELAAERLKAAGLAARAKANYTSVRRSLERAGELMRTAGQRIPAPFLIPLGEACFRVGDTEAAEQALGEAIERTDDPPVLADALYWSARIAERRADSARERALLDRALPIAERVGGDTLTRVLVGLTNWEAQHGDLDRAESLGRRAIVVGGHGSFESGTAYSALALVATLRNDHEQAEAHITAAAALARASGNLDLECRSVGNLGTIMHLRGDAGDAQQYARAAARYAESYALARRLGLVNPTVTAAINLAQVSIRLGDDATAARYVREAVALAIDADAKEDLLFCLVIEADRLASTGAIDDGRRLLALARSHPVPYEELLQEVDRVATRCGIAPGDLAAELDTDLDVAFDTAIEAILARST